MKILVLIGSPRIDGNSAKVYDYLKNHRLKDKYQLEAVYLSSCNIQTCKSCYECLKTNKCVIHDDVEGIVNKMLQADIIIYMPVIYAFSCNSVFQAFLERSGFGYLRPMNRPLKDKIANVILVGRRYSHNNVFAQFMLNIYLNQMIVVGSGFPLNIFSPGTFPGNALNDEEGLQSIDNALERMIECYDKLHKKNTSLIYKLKPEEALL